MFTSFIKNQIRWSFRTFGKHRSHEGLCRHIEQKLQEIRGGLEDDKTPWLDIVILALDGYWRERFDDMQGPLGVDLEVGIDSKIAETASAELEDLAASNWFERKWPPIARMSSTEPIKHL